MKRKGLLILMGALLLGSAPAVMAGEAQESQKLTVAAAAADENDYDTLTVGTTTAFDGCFFTDMWSNVSSDIDVRFLIHGYNLAEWRDGEMTFGIDPSVVSGVTVTDNEAGDRTYLLNIYDDLTYCDGTPITARDYAFSMLLSISPQAGEIGAALKDASYILGYDAYSKGEAACLSGVRILGDHMLSITISHEYLPFYYEAALLDCTPYPISRIAPGCVVKDDGDGIYIANEDETVEEPLFTAGLLRETILNEETGYMSHPDVTSGPYRLVSYDGKTAEFEINEYYKGNSKGNTPTIQRLIFTTVKNEEMVGELADGTVDLLTRCVNASALQEGTKLVDADASLTAASYPRSGLSLISFCCERPAVSSDAVRKAIAMCLDKQAMVDDYVGSFGQASDGYYGIGQWMYKLLTGAQPFPVEKPKDQKDTQAQQKYDAEMKRWASLSLGGVQKYAFDVNGAAALLEADGWTLNRDGEAFDPAKDDVRCKEIEGELTPLDLKILVPEGNAIHESMDKNFIPHLKEAGILLEVEVQPLSDLLKEYYGQQERACDMIYLATNFDVLFDPAKTFKPVKEGDPGQNTHNTTHINDEELYQRAVNMSRTEPGDALSYCEKWAAFEERFAQVLPAIPVYSNLYYDFYTRTLKNYNISASISWGEEIVNSYLSDAGN